MRLSCYLNTFHFQNKAVNTAMESRQIGNTARGDRQEEEEESGSARISTRCTTYQKTRDAATTSGQDYEVAICCLMFLRALRFTRDFSLASNHAGAGKFDDVVLHYRLHEDRCDSDRTILLQAKHKDVSRSQARPFDFGPYFKSFQKVRHQWEPSTAVTLVLYTNEVSTTPDVVDGSVERHLRDLLHTGGRLQRVLDASQVGLDDGEDTADFLGRLLECSGQMSNATADGYLEHELTEVLKLRAPEVARSLNLEFKRLVKEWWSEKKEGRYLSSDADQWNTILAKQFARLNADMGGVDRLLNVIFSQAALQEFSRLTKKFWVSVKDKHQVALAKMRLFKARPSVLFVDADSFEEVSALWGTSACGTVAVDLFTGSPEDPHTLLESLEAAVGCHPGRFLVVFARVSPTGSDWSLGNAGATWSDLDEATQDSLLSTSVVLQGQEVALRDVVGSHVADVMTDQVIHSVIRATDAIKLGDELPPTLEYFVQRCLERTSSDVVTFESLRKTNTLIGYREMLTASERFDLKRLQLSDLKWTRKVQGATVIDETLTKYQFRKLCCKYGVRGIWGRLGSKGVEDDVTEIIPLTWVSQEKVIVVEGDPGIGKSSFVTWMCTHLKERFPEAWVLRIEMGKHSEFIKEADFKDNWSKVKKFLWMGLSPSGNDLEDLLLDQSLRVTGNVFLYFDAFDEISPDYTEKCCDLLKEITKNVKFRQMVVSTRSVTRNEVEESLSTKAFSLPVFHKEEQRSFLKKFFHTHGKSVDVREMSALCGPIFEIPLLCKMAAKVILQDQDKNFLKSGSPWSKVLLYQLFLDGLVRKGLNDKYKFDRCAAGLESLYESYKESQYQYLQELAAKIQLPVAQLAHFRFRDKKPDVKTGIVVGTGKDLAFEHQTFAEHFLGLWLADNWERCPDGLLASVLFQPDKELVTSTFNWRLFEGCPLHSAVARGDVDSVRQCLSSATSEDRGGRSPLHVAALTDGNQREVWELLVAEGQDLDGKDRVMQWRAMEYAEATGHWEMVDFVLAKGQDVSYMKFANDNDAAKRTLLEAIKRDLPHLFQNVLRLDEAAIRDPLGGLRDTPLHVAAAAGSVNVVRTLLELRNAVNAKNSRGVTPLHVSSGFGHAEVARLLLENGADIKQRDSNGNNAFLLAAKRGHVEVVTLLHQHGANVDVKHPNGNVALLEASAGGHADVVRFLSQHVESINTRGNNGNTAALLASRNGHSEVLQLLMQTGADINLKNVYWDSPLLQASRRGFLEIVRTILEGGADVNMRDYSGSTALQEASAQGHSKVVKMLLDSDANVNVKDYDGLSALHLTSRNGYPEVVGLLLQNGAVVNVRDNRGSTALQEASEQGHSKVVKMLLDSDAKVNVKGITGLSALHLASINGYPEVVGLLLESEADPNVRGSWGATPSIQASANGHVAVLSRLLEKGAELNLKDVDGRSALTHAATGGHLEVVNVLLENGADVNARDNNGNTALMQASRNGFLEVMTKLLDKGADVNARNDNGRTALMQALVEDDVTSIDEEDTDVMTNLSENLVVCESYKELFSLLLDTSMKVKDYLDQFKDANMVYMQDAKEEVLKILLKNGADVNRKDINGQTALTQAARNGFQNVVKVLLENGADVNAPDNKGTTALMEASKNGHVVVVSYLLGNGAEMDMKDLNGYTALLHATAGDETSVIMEILKEMAVRNAKYSSLREDDHLDTLNRPLDNSVVTHCITPLGTGSWGVYELKPVVERNGEYFKVKYYCGVTNIKPGEAEECEEMLAKVNQIAENNPPILHLSFWVSLSGGVRTILVQVNENVTAKYTHMINAMHLASKSGDIELLRCLAEEGANVNVEDVDGVTALQKASESGHLDIVSMLLKAGANVNAEDVDGVTALLKVSESGHPNVVKMLLEAGANVNKEDVDGVTALLKVSESGHLDVVRMLLEAGANVNTEDVDGVTALQKASESGHPNVVKMLLEAGANVNKEDVQGVKALQQASTSGHLDVVWLLLEAGTNVNAKDVDGVTALQKASESGHPNVVKMLLEAGANVNAEDVDGVTALLKASTSGHHDVVRLLLEAGANVNAEDVDGVTALQKASESGHLDVVKMLLEAGANVIKEDVQGVTALQQASTSGHLDVVRVLLEAGANVNSQDINGFTVLRHSADRGHSDVVRMLLEAGANVNAEGVDGVTALQKASESGHLDVVKMLIEAGANVKKDVQGGVMALQQASTLGNLDVARMLLKAGTNVNAEDVYGVTALQKASVSGHPNVVKMLLEAGANVNKQDVQGVTALQKALTSGHLDVVRVLLQSGANVNSQDINGFTVLHHSADRGHSDVVRVLLEAGANVNAENVDGVTALQKASESRHLDIVSMLLKAGANVNAEDVDGVTALQKASESGHLDVVRMLLEAGANVNAENVDGVTALQQASAAGHVEAARTLLKNGADANANDHCGRTALHVASRNGHLDVVCLLLDRRTDIEDNDTDTAMLWASREKLLEIDELLQEKGSDVDAEKECVESAEGGDEVSPPLMLNAVDHFGDPPLLLAAANGHSLVLKTLLEAGADVNMRNDYGDTAFLLASKDFCLDATRQLLDHGADPNAKYANGDTATIRAARKGHVEFVRLMVECGADLAVRDSNGNTALMWAEKKRNRQVANMLLEGQGPL